MPDIERVVEFLAKEFNWDDDTRSIARDAVARNLAPNVSPGDLFELICDHPAIANYRLKRTRGGGLRMGYYGHSSVGQARADRLTKELEGLDG
jgi:hypothetical protein